MEKDEKKDIDVAKATLIKKLALLEFVSLEEFLSSSFFVFCPPSQPLTSQLI